MSKIYASAQEIIGNTPLMEVRNIEKQEGLSARILVKLEYLNPAGSAKDRAALFMLNDAEEKGLVDRDTVIIEPTSGNTGIGLASIGAVRGYHTIIVMPDTMSQERIKTMAAYGAEVVLTPGALGMKGAIAKAEELAKSFPKSFIPGQFDNPANALAHYKTTGPEIFRDTDGNVDAFVAGVGTGGTVSGVGKYLKEKNNNILIAAVEPADSPLISKGFAGSHKLQGIGANFVPSLYNAQVVDEVITITTEEAYGAARMMGRMEGILVGISSGAALSAAVKLAKRPEFNGKTIVALLPDTGDRYLSTELFDA